MMRFRDRTDAGRRLAHEILNLAPEQPIVLAIPRGGVPVAFEVARALGTSLDVLVVRKVGSPDRPGLGIGALAEGTGLLPDAHALWLLDGSGKDVDRIKQQESDELERRVALYRGRRPLPDVRGRTVVLVDDGVMTGLTVRAALRSLRSRHPKRIILAIPCGRRDTVAGLRAEVDEVICLDDTHDALCLWYDHFPAVSDAEVVSLLEQARQELPAAAAPP